MKWRYQPVILTHKSPVSEPEDYVTLIEVYSPDGKPDGPLSSWEDATPPGRAPYGDDQAELIGVLTMMLKDALAWKAVRYDDLKAGLMFERMEEGD